jgi:endonuclease III
MSASSPRRKSARRAPVSEAKPARTERVQGPAAHEEAARPLRAATVTRHSSEAEAWAARISEEKPVRYLVQNLERAYGVPENKWTSWDVLDMLVAVILSQATSDANSERTYDALKRRFPTWDSVLAAREQTLVETIRLGGLANQKARVIRDLLRQIKGRHNSFDLSFVKRMPARAAAQYLSGFRGVGPKTIACTLLFACGAEVFPLDTHIFRILRRVGLIPAKCSDAFAHEVMDRLVPAGKFYSFHVNLIRHGRALCRPRDPVCERCPIVEYCDYGRERI